MDIGAHLPSASPRPQRLLAEPRELGREPATGALPRAARQGWLARWLERALDEPAALRLHVQLGAHLRIIYGHAQEARERGAPG
jgi:hypothetical protein